MIERPIIFSATMVRAILAETKTQTRRLAKPVLRCESADVVSGRVFRCPYGIVGDLLWVREAWGVVQGPGDPCERSDLEDARRQMPWAGVWYRGDANGGHGEVHRWRSPIHMPRWASRITLEIVGVRLEPLQRITQEDARAEGVEAEWCDPDDGERYESLSGEDIGGGHGYTSPRSYVAGFMRAWDRINGKSAPWAMNPLVWVIEFARRAA